MTTTTTSPQLAITRIFDTPRATLYQEFTDPDRLAVWWGPIGHSLPRDEMEIHASAIRAASEPSAANSTRQSRRSARRIDEGI